MLSLSLLCGEMNSGEIALVMNIPVISQSCVRVMHTVLRNLWMRIFGCVSPSAESNYIQFTYSFFCKTLTWVLLI